MARIAVGGFQHETNTFAPGKATFADFERHDGWPGLVRGPAMLDAVDGLNLPIAGFAEAARAAGHELVPLSWCAAEPCAHVTSDAFERITAMLCEDLGAQGPFDAVYLDLHGAMVAEAFEDGEGETLRRARAVVGDAIPLAVSLDLHANVTQAMLDHASVMAIYRTYPHIDFAATGARAYRLLEPLLAGARYAKALRKASFLVPLSAQCTDFEPCASLYGRLPGIESEEGVVGVDFAAAFPPADIAECGPAIVAYGRDQASADTAADAMMAALDAAEGDFVNPLLGADEAVRRALESTSSKPVVMADAQDNPGAGGSGDTVGLLEALVKGGARGAVLAVFTDAEAVAQAQARGVGASFEADFGGKSGQPGQRPYSVTLAVEALGDGVFTCTGAMLAGTRTALGPMALLRVVDPGSDVRVVVAGTRFQCMDQEVFRHLGVEPAAERIVAVKSTVHFRADFAPIAAEVLTVEAPGAHPCRLDKVAYRNLRDGVRLGPGGPVYRRAGADRG